MEEKLPRSLKNLDLNTNREPKNKIIVSAYLSSSRKPLASGLNWVLYLGVSMAVVVMFRSWILTCFSHRNVSIEIKTSFSCELMSWSYWEAFRGNDSLFS